MTAPYIGIRSAVTRGHGRVWVLVCRLCKTGWGNSEKDHPAALAAAQRHLDHDHWDGWKYTPQIKDAA